MPQKNPLETVSSRTYLKRKFIFQIILMVCIVGFCLLSVLAKYNPYLFFDPYITKSAQQIDIYGFHTLMRFITLMGNYPISLLLTGSVVLLFLAIGKKKDGLTILVSTLGILLISYYLKIFISRPRPDPLLIQLKIPLETTMSFPSSHVLFFIGLFGALLFIAFTQLKNRLLRIFIVAFCFGLIILVGVSRIYLGMHWFSDVLGSYFIGFIWLYIIVALYRRFH